MTFKIVSELSHRKDSSVQFPYSGLTKFNAEGIAEIDVSESELERLLAAIPDLSVFVEKKPDLTSTGDNLLDKETENDLGLANYDNKLGTGNEPPLDDLTKELTGLKVAELKKLASDSGFPEEEWIKLTKEPLIAYLKAKLDAAN